MTTEQREKIPSGYIWKKLPGINSQMPMPDTWFYMGVEVPGTNAFFMTRESIPKRGIFTTGVTVNAYSEFNKKLGGSSGSFAQEFLKNLPILQPAGEITTEENGPLTICRRRFILPVARYMTTISFHGELVTKLMPPSHFYYLAAGNC